MIRLINKVIKFLAKTCSIRGIFLPEIFTMICIKLKDKAESIIEKIANFILFLSFIYIALKLKY